MALPVGNPDRGVGGGDIFDGGIVVVTICHQVSAQAAHTQYIVLTPEL